MKKQLFLSILLSLGVTGAVSAQGIFKVIASSGSTNKGGVPVKVGTAINTTEQIVVGTKSYLGLSYAKGGTVQISKAGTYSAKDLETKLLASSKSATQKYADFIIGEVVKGNDANIHKNPYAYQSVTGSVERSLFTQIVVELPEFTQWLGNQYTFAWHPVANNKTYTVKLYDTFDDVAQSFTLQDTTCTIDFTSPKLKELDFVKIVVNAVENGSANLKVLQYSFQKDPKYTEYKTKIDAFVAQAGKDLETDANKQVELAVLLEEYNFLVDAKLAYEKAIQLDTENPTFQIAYDQFKIRKSIGKKPKEAEEAKKGE